MSGNRSTGFRPVKIDESAGYLISADAGLGQTGTQWTEFCRKPFCIVAMMVGSLRFPP